MSKKKAQHPPQPDSSQAPQALTSLGLVVFISGAVLMSLEIVGSRVLAPYFGNSVYVWGSLIGIFLAALSVGYIAGGRIADRWPSQGLLCVLSVAAAAMILAIPYMATGVCESLIAEQSGDKMGPLIASLFLFFLPSVLMGMVSPLAIKLVARDVGGIGTIAGNLYALSTIGSIAGTLATTFILIPNVGSKTIIRILGIAMAVLPIVFVVSRSRPTATIALGLVVAACGFLAPAVPSFSLGPSQQLLMEAETPYHGVAVIDDPASGLRSLRFNSFVESAIYLKPPFESACEYTYLFHLARVFSDQLSSVVFIGAGGGIGPRSFHRHYPTVNIEVVDIDPVVLRVARDYFHMQEDARLTPRAEDGRIFIHRSRKLYDSIILDAFSIGGRIPFHLVSSESFAAMKGRLAPGGVLLMNINSSLKGPMSTIYRSMYRTLKAVFSDVYSFPVIGGVERDPRGIEERSRNIILVATNGPRKFTKGEVVARAEELDSTVLSDLPPLAGSASHMVTEPVELGDAHLMSDDFAPIETMRF